MTEVKEVRAALEKLNNAPMGTQIRAASAIVSGGLTACDEYEKQAKDDDFTTPGFHEYVMGLRIKVAVFASILRKAGLLK